MRPKKHLNGPRKRGSQKCLELLAVCPLCATPYRPAKARVLDEQQGRHFLHIQCQKCGNSILAVLLFGANGMSSVGMITDLTGEDAARFKDAFGVSADDVIGIHELLKEGKIFVEKLKSV